MKIPVPQQWKTNIKYFLDLVNSNGFQIINPPDEIKRITFSVLLQTQQEINQKITAILAAEIPADIKTRLYFQPTSGYHTTLQWTEIPGDNLKTKIAQEIETYMRDIISIKAKLIGPYTSAKSIFFIAIPYNDVVSCRGGIDNILRSHGLKTRLPLEFNLM